MSDVSGIPYMGPMGQGNFFAPSFSYNPQVTSAGYAWPADVRGYRAGVLQDTQRSQQKGGILQDTQRSQQHSSDLIRAACDGCQAPAARTCTDYTPGGGSSSNYSYGSLFGTGDFAAPPSS